jgi:hypothetical protein
MTQGPQISHTVFVFHLKTCRMHLLSCLRTQRIHRLAPPIAVIDPIFGRLVMRSLEPLHLALTQPQMLGRFPHRDPPRHRILNYFDSLQFRLAQCHPLLSTGGDKVPEQLKSDKIAEQLQALHLSLTGILHPRYALPSVFPLLPGAGFPVRAVSRGSARDWTFKE